MSRFSPPPIIRACERLLVDVEAAVRRFPRHHRYAIGTDIRHQAMAVYRRANRAWRDRAKQSAWVEAHTVPRRRVVAHAGQALAAWERQHVRARALHVTPGDLRAITARWNSYLGHLKHASSARLQGRLHRRYPWLASATRRRRFSVSAEGRRLTIPYAQRGG